MTNISHYKALLGSSALIPVSLALLPSPALADCLASANPLIVTCDGTGGTAGYSTTLDGVTITVTSAGNIVSSCLSTGANSVANNTGTINNSVSVGGGSTVTNAPNATGNAGTGGIVGPITFGATSGTQVNIFNNNTSSAALVGKVNSNLTSSGSTTFNNQGLFSGSITQTGAGTVVINNGSTFTTSAITGPIVTSGNTTLNNTNSATITGNITFGAGNDVINNTGTITGNADMGGGTNVYNAGSQAQLPVGVYPR